MTTIKPASGPSPTAEGVLPETTGTPAADFRAALDATPSEVASAAEPAAAGAVASLAAAVRIGTVTPAQAVESVVRGALEGPLASGLTATGRAQLEARLRAALASDPSLRALIGDLERAR